MLIAELLVGVNTVLYLIVCVLRPAQGGEIKDKRDPLASAGVYRVLCSYEKIYIGTTKRSVNTRIKEQRRCCRLICPEKSGIAEKALNNSEYRMLFDDTVTQRLQTVAQGYTEKPLKCQTPE